MRHRVGRKIDPRPPPSLRPFRYFPITAYFLAAIFDVISAIGGTDHAWAGEFWHAGTFCFVAGVALNFLMGLFRKS